MGNKRKYIFANKLHKVIFMSVFVSAVLPSLFVLISMYCLCFMVIADEVAMPETIAVHIIPAAQKVFLSLLVIVPFFIFLLLFFAYKVSHTIVGPFDRIVRELSESISGTRQGPITIRKTDKFLPLVEKINLLLDRLGKQ